MSNWYDATSPEVFSEPIQAKKDVSIEVTAAVSGAWTVKDIVPGYAGKTTKTVKVTIQITDPDVKTEHEDAKPKLVFEQAFNIEPHYYLDAKSGTVKAMRPGLLFTLEDALGFDPVFVDGQGNVVEPFVTRNGNKIAPKGVEGVSRKLNADFANAYFNDDGTPNLNWSGIKVYADIELQSDEKYGDKNQITRFKKAPVSV